MTPCSLVDVYPSLRKMLPPSSVCLQKCQDPEDGGICSFFEMSVNIYQETLRHIFKHRGALWVRTMPWVMKMDAGRSSETSVNIYPTSRRHIPEERQFSPSRLVLHRHAPEGTKERQVHSNLLPADIQTQYLSSVNHTRRDISQQPKGRTNCTQL